MSTRTPSFERRQVLGREVPLPPKWVRMAVSVVGFFVIWWGVNTFGIPFFKFGLFPGPIGTFTALAGYLTGEPVLAGSQSIYFHAFYSAFRVVLGVVIATVLAVPLGLLIGASQRWADYLFPAAESLRAIPPVAWVPVSILIFPTLSLTSLTINTAVVFVVFVGAFFPILVNTVEGVQSIEDEYRRAAASLGASSWQTFRHVVFPAALPSILTGITLGIGLGWITVVAAEIVGGNYGLGYVTFQAYRLLQNDVVAVGMITIGALGYVSSALVQWAANRAMPWNQIDTNR